MQPLAHAATPDFSEKAGHGLLILLGCRMTALQPVVKALLPRKYAPASKLPVGSSHLHSPIPAITSFERVLLVLGRPMALQTL